MKGIPFCFDRVFVTSLREVAVFPDEGGANLPIFSQNFTKTRMYSSRMLAVRCSSRLSFHAHPPPGADPGGAPGARAPPLTLGFEAPKLSIFGPYLIFSIFFFASLRSVYYFFNMLLFHSSNRKIFQPHFARHVISHLEV